MVPQRVNSSFKLLSDDEIKKIQCSTLRVLEKTGVRFTLPEAQDIFRSHGLKVDKDGKVYFSPYVVEDAIKKSPSMFTRYPLDSSYKEVVMGGDNLYFSSGGSPLWILDLEAKRRLVQVKDIADYVRLVDGLENLALCHGGFCAGLLSKDVPKKSFHAIHFENLVTNTRKPASTADITNKTIAKDLIELISIVLGGLDELARKKTYRTCALPEAPLQWGIDAVALIEWAKVGLPIEITPMPFAGSGSSVTLAGTVVQLNAEVLSGVVLSQLVNPGAPVMYGIYPGIMDMGSANHSTGCPEAALICAAAVQLSRWLGIPNITMFGTTDSKISDAQAGYEKMMVLLPVLAGANHISGFGGLIGLADTLSLEQLVIDDEIAGNVLRILKGIDVTEDKLAVDVIDSVVHKTNNFLEHEHTLKYFKEEQYFTSIGDRNYRSVWEREGSQDIRERAREKGKKILREHFPSPIDKDMQKELKSRVKSMCEREGESYPAVGRAMT